MTHPIDRDAFYRRRRFAHDVIETCVHWYLTYRLTYRDLVALMELSANSVLISAELGLLFYAPSPPQARRPEKLAGASHAYSMRIAEAIRRGDPNGARLATMERIAGLSSDARGGRA